MKIWSDFLSSRSEFSSQIFPTTSSVTNSAQYSQPAPVNSASLSTTPASTKAPFVPYPFKAGPNSTRQPPLPIQPAYQAPPPRMANIAGMKPVAQAFSKEDAPRVNSMLAPYLSAARPPHPAPPAASPIKGELSSASRGNLNLTTNSSKLTPYWTRDGLTVDPIVSEPSEQSNQSKGNRIPKPSPQLVRSNSNSTLVQSNGNSLQSSSDLSRPSSKLRYPPLKESEHPPPPPPLPPQSHRRHSDRTRAEEGIDQAVGSSETTSALENAPPQKRVKLEGELVEL
jgi:hypothetical protein